MPQDVNPFLDLVEREIEERIERESFHWLDVSISCIRDSEPYLSPEDEGWKIFAYAAQGRTYEPPKSPVERLRSWCEQHGLSVQENAFDGTPKIILDPPVLSRPEVH